MTKFASYLLACILLIAVNSTAQTPPQKLRWFKGNTHTHTTNSDGDSSPMDVARWYKTNGYNFLFFTDHEHITSVDELNAEFGKAGDFLAIRGQEISDRHPERGPLHVNALGTGTVIRPTRQGDVVTIVQRNVDAVRKLGGVAQINHPNYFWAISAAELLQIRDAAVVEIFSGHPKVNVFGGGGEPSAEEKWDYVLSRGMQIFAVAVDDSHSLKKLGDRSAPTPGHGWIVVRAAELTPSAILEAITRGDFYASSGIELEDYSVTSSEIRVTIKEVKNSKYRTQFIGPKGRVLSESITNPAVYKRTGREQYVRAKVFESNGSIAWTQPVFRSRR